MQTSSKGWTKDQNIDLYEEMSFFLVKYAVFIKNENDFFEKF